MHSIVDLLLAVFFFAVAFVTLNCDPIHRYVHPIAENKKKTTTTTTRYVATANAGKSLKIEINASDNLKPCDEIAEERLRTHTHTHIDSISLSSARFQAGRLLVITAYSHIFDACCIHICTLIDFIIFRAATLSKGFLIRQ